MKELTVQGFLNELLEQHQTRKDRPFCWILGAGASVSSEIPTAGKLARIFLERLCEDATGTKEGSAEWARSGALGIKGFDPADPGRHYAELYELRYGDCPEAGYAFLEDVMRDKRPSYGYAVLAMLLEQTPHRIVITTNFDNLVADALSVHSTTFPRVVGHAQLTQFVQTEVRRPLVAKVHGDLGFRVRNTPGEIESLDAEWKQALERIFQRCTPIVIGYGGNDQSLMKFICELGAGVPDRIYWCQWEREQPAPHVADYLGRRKGARLVRHKGFDLLMLLLESKLRQSNALNLPSSLTDHLATRQAARLDSFRSQSEALAKELATSRPVSVTRHTETAVESQERQAIAVAAVQSLKGSLVGREAKTWWAWELEAGAAQTVDERDAIYQAAIEELPESAPLLGNYANFLRNERRELDRAETFYRRALAADPGLAEILGNYATFLWDERRDISGAEELYRRALAADSVDANILGNFANFLRIERHDIEQAEAFYKRALDVDPRHSNNIGSYATVFRLERRDAARAEELFKRALEAEPRHANNLGNYAQLLLASGRREEGWERLEQALACGGQFPALLVELWFYAYAHGGQKWPDALGRLKSLLQAGTRSRGWDLSDNVARARSDGHPEPELVAALSEVIGERADIASLGKFPAWTETAAITPDKST